MNKPLPTPNRDFSGQPRPRLLPAFLALAVTGSAVVQAVEVSYQYYRFTPTKNRTDTQNQTQLSEFEFHLRGVKVDHTPLTAPGAVTGGTNAPDANEGASKLVDGNVNTKWFSNTKEPVVFNFGTPTTIDSYRFATANDSLDRTPIQWTIEGSNDGTNYLMVDARNGGDNATPTAYFTFRPILITTPPAATTPLPVFGSFNTTATEVDTSVEGQPVYQAFPSIVKNAGPGTSFSWQVNTTANSVPTGVTLLPENPAGLGDAGTYAQAVIAPDVFTDYTLTATTAAGTAALNHKIRAVPGGSATARYIRFQATTLRGGQNSNLVQVAEIEFFNGETKLGVVSVENPSGNNNNNANEVAAKIIDGDFRTKWLNHNNAPLIFDLGETPLTFDSYQLTTGNDGADRDPVRWVIEKSDDGINWSLVDNVYNYTPPSQRRAKSGLIPVSGITTLDWAGGTDGVWDTANTNWVTSGTVTPAAYGNGVNVVFGAAGNNRDITLSEALSPNSVSVINTEATPYSIGGTAPITGQADFFKRGSGEVALNGANSFFGAVYLSGGSTVVNHAEALGTRSATNRLDLSGGAELRIATNAASDRRLRIGSGGGTINVDAGVSFTKYGPLDFLGTLTKSGEGTLQFNGYSGGGSAFAPDDIVVNEGTLEFNAAVGYFNSRPAGPQGADSVKLTVNTGGTARFLIANALGGDYVNRQSSLEQVRILGGTLDLASGFNYIHNGLAPSGEGRIVLQGGVLTGSGQIEPANEEGDVPQVTTTFTVLASPESSFIAGTGALAINPGNSSLTIDVADGEAAEDLIIYKAIQGSRPFTKLGAGTMSIAAAENSYNGPLTVSGGTVRLAGSIGTADAGSTLSLAAGTTLTGTGAFNGTATLDGTVIPGDEFMPQESIGLGNTTLNGTLELDIDGDFHDQVAVTGTLALGASAVLEVSGTLTQPIYPIITHSGTRTGTFTGFTAPAGYTLVYGASAISLVAEGTSAYDAWAAGLSDPSPEADIDGDGLSNVLEFVLDSDANASSTGDAPTATRNEQGDFVFTFVRKASAAYLNPAIEYSTTLEGDAWTTFAGQAQEDTPSAGLTTVTATLPASLAGPGGKLFARLKVEVPVSP